MSKSPNTSDREEIGSRISSGMAMPAFFLLFSVQLKEPFTGFPELPSEITPFPDTYPEAYNTLIYEFERRTLGEMFLETKRISHWPLGRILFNNSDSHLPEHADVFLLYHKAGVAVWEVWLPAPEQPINFDIWNNWLNLEDLDSLARKTWEILRPINLKLAGTTSDSVNYFPITILIISQNALTALTEQYGQDVIKMLFQDRSSRGWQKEVVAQELNRNYCVRENEITLFSRRGGIDICELESKKTNTDVSNRLPPHNVLPFLLNAELLLNERAILVKLYEKMSLSIPDSIEELLQIKQEILDGREEYYGAIITTNRFSDRVLSDGTKIFGIDELHQAVMDRLDAVSFEITMRYQKKMTLFQFWLTIVFGATEIGFIASGIATWYYYKNLWLVLAWTVGTALISGFFLVFIFRKKLK